MDIYLVKPFSRWAKKQKIGNELLQRRAIALIKAVEQGKLTGDRLTAGVTNLGGGLYKHRFSFAGSGARGGARTVVAFTSGDILFYLYGFRKKDRANLTASEQAALKLEARTLLDLGTDAIRTAVAGGVLVHIPDLECRTRTKGD